jgi:hypothetical protein
MGEPAIGLQWRRPGIKRLVRIIGIAARLGAVEEGGTWGRITGPILGTVNSL